MQRWICTVCQNVYDPSLGDTVNEVPAGVSFEELLDDWTCPVCKSAKRYYEPLPAEPG